MIIKLTQSHIDRGCRGDGQACPVALAITEATGYDCLVESDFITLYEDELLWRQRIPTPKPVQVFISDFDADARVEPFEFELDVEGVGINGNER